MDQGSSCISFSKGTFFSIPFLYIQPIDTLLLPNSFYSSELRLCVPAFQVQTKFQPCILFFSRFVDGTFCFLYSLVLKNSEHLVCLFAAKVVEFLLSVCLVFFFLRWGRTSEGLFFQFLGFYEVFKKKIALSNASALPAVLCQRIHTDPSSTRILVPESNYLLKFPIFVFIFTKLMHQHWVWHK